MHVPADHASHVIPPAARPAVTSTEVLVEVAEGCRRRGLNLTPIRRRVMEVVAGSPGPVSAYAIIHRLSTDRLVAPPTVYRALEFLIDAGFVRHLALRKAYARRMRPDAEPPALLVCTGCGSVDESAFEPMRRTVALLAEANGFEASAHPIEIAGRCAACRDTPVG